MAASNLEVLRKLLKCSVCLNDFSHPKLLHCGHTFCTICLEHILQQSPYHDKLVCPQCREQSWVPNGIDDLKNDFRIKQIKASLEALESCDEIEKCECCKVKEGAVFCVQCHVALCHQCMENHGLRYTSHKVILRGNLSNCRQHGQLCTLFCTQCMRTICSCCAFQQCQGHATQDIPDVTCVDNAAVEKYVDLTDRYFTERSKQIANDFDGMKLKIRGQFEEINKRLRTRCDYLMLEVDNARDDVLSKLEAAREKQLNILNMGQREEEPDGGQESGLEFSRIVSAMAVPKISTESSFMPYDNLELGQIFITYEESTIESTPLSQLEVSS